MYISALFLLVQIFDERQFQVGILKGKKCIFEKLGQDRGKQSEKAVEGARKDKKGKKVNIF